MAFSSRLLVPAVRTAVALETVAVGPVGTTVMLTAVLGRGPEELREEVCKAELAFMPCSAGAPARGS